MVSLTSGLFKMAVKSSGYDLGVLELIVANGQIVRHNTICTYRKSSLFSVKKNKNKKKQKQKKKCFLTLHITEVLKVERLF